MKEFIEKVYNLVGSIGDDLDSIERHKKQANEKLVKLEEEIEAFVNE